MDFWHDSAVQKRWLLRLTLFIGLLLVPVFVLAVFARPSADDYIYAARTHAVMQQYGFDLPRLLKAAWDTNVYYFENWQGLYVSGFLLAWQPAIFGNAWYGVTLLCVLVPLFFCLYGACRCVVRRLDQAQKLLPWALALLVCFAFIEGMPAPVEGLYTDLKCCIGGLDGRKLTKGDTLPIGLCDTTALWQKIITRHLDRPLQDTCITTALHPVRTLGTQTFPLLRAVPGPQDAAFTSAGLHIFTHGVYQLTPNCDRMACKLAGPAIEMKHGADILSDGIAAGSVQISADSQPIVMLTDHQTTGGYAKIATVISADLPVLAQLRPGQAVAFAFVSPAQAVRAARRQAAILQQIAARLL